MLPISNRDEIIKKLDIESRTIFPVEQQKEKTEVEKKPSSKPLIIVNNDNINDNVNNDNTVEDKQKTMPPTEVHDEENSIKLDAFKSLSETISQTVPVGTKINLCIFNINQHYGEPYLQYLLYKYGKNKGDVSDKLVFPFFYLKNSDNFDNELDEYVKNSVNYEKIVVQQMGFYFTDGEYYVFYKISNLSKETVFLKRDDEWWLTTVYEIINLKHVCNFKILENVTKFFLKNSRFIRLVKKNGKEVVSPYVLYNGDSESIVNYISVFGMKKASIYSKFGPFYYFSNYNRAVRYGGWGSNYYGLTQEEIIEAKKKENKPTNDDGKYVKGGIVRFLIFYNNLKTFLNHPNDPDDKSVAVQKKIDRDDYIKDTIKISDVDGKWAENYDLCYATPFDKKYNSPTWTCKNIEQQLPLSYHYLNKETLGDTWDKDVKSYYIE